MPSSEVPVGTKVFAAGWGSTSSEYNPEAILHKASLHIQSDSDCSRYYRPDFYPETQLCAGSDRKDACAVFFSFFLFLNLFPYFFLTPKKRVMVEVLSSKSRILVGPQIPSFMVSYPGGMNVGLNMLFMLKFLHILTGLRRPFLTKILSIGSIFLMIVEKIEFFRWQDSSQPNKAIFSHQNMLLPF